MSFEKFFSANMSVALLISLKTVGNIANEAIQARIIDVRITWLSTFSTKNRDLWPGPTPDKKLEIHGLPVALRMLRVNE